MDFKVKVENETGCKIKSVRTDNGTEFCNDILREYFIKNGIRHQLTVPYNPEMNSRVERLHRTLVEMARTMLLEANCQEYLWAEAINTASYVKNRLPHKALPGVTPNELWFGSKPDLSNLKAFGCRAFSDVPQQFRKKTQCKAREFMYVGYFDDGTFRLFDPNHPSKIQRTIHVKFLEHEFISKVKTPSEFNRLQFLDLFTDESVTCSPHGGACSEEAEQVSIHVDHSVRDKVVSDVSDDVN